VSCARHRLALAVVGLALLLPRAARADVFPGGDADQPEARDSVYRVSWPVDIAVTAVGAFGTAVPFLISGKIIHPRCPCDPGHLNLIDRGSVGNNDSVFGLLGDVTVGVAVAAPAVFTLLTVRPLPTLIEDLTVYAEVMAVNGGLVTTAKFVVQRPTPRAYAGDPAVVNRPVGYLSFYSGHTSFTVAALSYASVTLSVRHHQRIWPWITTGLLGAFVATDMVLSGAHFPTDVMMGALSGAVVGVGIPLLHLRAAKRSQLRLTNGPGAGLALAGRF
jgi:membrane-associated phospholipid phosphatase